MCTAFRKVSTFRTWAFVCLLLTFSDGMWVQESSASKLPSSDWSGVIALGIGSDVQIDLASGQRVIGHLVSATADGVTLSVRRTEMTISRETIRRVALRGDRMTTRSAKRGFIIGAVAGGLMGTLGTKSNRLSWGAFLAGSWGAIGALIGAINGFSQRQARVVYIADVDSH